MGNHKLSDFNNINMSQLLENFAKSEVKDTVVNYGSLGESALRSISSR